MKLPSRISPEYMAARGIVDPCDEAEALRHLPEYQLGVSRRLDPFAGSIFVRQVRRHVNVMQQAFATVGGHETAAASITDRSLNGAFLQKRFLLRDNDLVRISGRIAIEFPNEDMDDDAPLEEGITYLRLRGNECLVGTLGGLFWEAGIDIVDDRLVVTPPVAKMDCTNVQLFTEWREGRSARTFDNAMVPLLDSQLRLERIVSLA